MTATTPREALANIRLISGTLLKHEIDAILTALKPWLDNQRTPGTVEVCAECRAKHYVGAFCTTNPNCPLKQVTNEKA